MKYEQIIKEEFAKIHYFPRDIQLKVINDILEAFLDNDKRYAVINVSTGGGKSLISFITHCCLKRIMFEISENDEGFSTYELNSIGQQVQHIDEVTATSAIYMHTNSLIDQYSRTFSNKSPKNFTIKGAANYNCILTPGETAESCCYKIMKKRKDPDKQMAAKIEQCEKNCYYRKVLKNFFAGGKDVIFSNYSIMLSYAMTMSKPLCNKMLSVYDEAQLMNDICASHLKIEVSSYSIQEEIEKIEDFESIILNEERESLHLLSNMLKEKMIDKNNYNFFLLELKSIYEDLIKKLDYMSEVAFNLRYEDFFKKFKRSQGYFSKKYNLLKEYFDINYEKEIEISEGFKKVRNGKTINQVLNYQLIIHPIFMKEFFKKFNNKFSNFYLFMSGTINKDFIIKTTGVEESQVVFIKSGPVFDPENKQLIFLNLDRYNKTTIQDPKIIKRAVDYVNKILNKHEFEKGIIQTPSFAVSQMIYDAISFNKTHTVFNHCQGESVTKSLELFKECSEPSVLISPSLFEGIDLPDEQSRFQILVKAPYPSIGDVRIKYILEKHSDFYQMITINKIIQSFGRSVRNETDHCITYCLDSLIYNLFTQPYNTWKDEFLSKKLN